MSDKKEEVNNIIKPDICWFPGANEFASSAVFQNYVQKKHKDDSQRYHGYSFKGIHDKNDKNGYDKKTYTSKEVADDIYSRKIENSIYVVNSASGSKIHKVLDGLKDKDEGKYLPKQIYLHEAYMTLGYKFDEKGEPFGTDWDSFIEEFIGYVGSFPGIKFTFFISRKTYDRGGNHVFIQQLYKKLQEQRKLPKNITLEEPLENTNHACYTDPLQKNEDQNQVVRLNAEHLETKCFGNKAYNGAASILIDHKAANQACEKAYQSPKKKKAEESYKQKNHKNAISTGMKIGLGILFVIGLIGSGLFGVNAYLGFFGGGIFSGLGGVGMAVGATLLCLLPALIVARHHSIKGNKTGPWMKVFVASLIAGFIMFSFSMVSVIVIALDSASKSTQPIKILQFFQQTVPMIVALSVSGVLIILGVILAVVGIITRRFDTEERRKVFFNFVIGGFITFSFSVVPVIVIALNYWSKPTQLSEILQFLQQPVPMIVALGVSGALMILSLIVTYLGTRKDRGSARIQYGSKNSAMKGKQTYTDVLSSGNLDQTILQQKVLERIENSSSESMQIDNTIMQSCLGKEYIQDYTLNSSLNESTIEPNGSVVFDTNSTQYTHTITLESGSYGVPCFNILSKAGDSASLFNKNSDIKRIFNPDHVKIIKKDSDDSGVNITPSYKLCTSQAFKENCRELYEQIKQLTDDFAENNNVEFSEEEIEAQVNDDLDIKTDENNEDTQQHAHRGCGN